MALKEITFDLLTEDRRNILTEDRKSFLIIKRDWIEIEITQGGGVGLQPFYEPYNKITVKIRFGKNKKVWAQTILVNPIHLANLIGVIAKFKGVKTSIVEIFVKLKNKLNS